MATSAASVCNNKALLVNCLGIEDITPFQLIVEGRKHSCVPKVNFCYSAVEFSGDSECGGHDSFLWSVNNKYYQAKILLKYCHVYGGDQIDVNAGEYEAVVLITREVGCVC